MTPTTALEKTSANSPPAQALTQPVQITAASITLDRENLTFFANMITSADLIPAEKERVGGQWVLMPLEKRKFRVMAKICAGIPHGFDPIGSQKNLHIIDGRIELSAQGMNIKLKRLGKYDVRVKTLTNEECLLVVLEKNADEKWIVKGEVKFTWEQAKKAGLTEKAVWKAYPQDMLFAACMRRIARRFAPEALDTIAVGYDLAKRGAGSEPEAVATPAQLQAAPETQAGGEYQDEAFVEADAADLVEFASAAEEVEVADSDGLPFDEEQAYSLESLRADAASLLEEKTGGDTKKKKGILGDRVIGELDEDAVTELIDELTKL